jgi:probable DNA repair protein
LTVERGEGGTGILKDQALCPFRAFVHYRLRGHELDRSQPGIDAMTRGDLLHRVLEYFWRDVGNQQRLLELGQDTLTDKIGEHVEQAIDDIFAGQSRPAETLLDLEKDRLTGLVGEWLTDVEAVRSTFEIHELEQEHFEQIGPLKIRTVVDRIDRLVDGSRVVLDYKTGTSKVDGLLGERLLEPQLPIYAVAASDSKADGVAFAQVRRGDCRMLGIARDDGLLPKVPGVRNSKPLQELGVGDWTQLLGYWRQQLEQLATDFVSGEARVEPVSYDKACQYCDLAGLCRIGEARYQSEPGEVVS